jgi:hypothetical protein
MTAPGDVLADIADERRRQDNKWGEQNHPDGTGGPHTAAYAAHDKALCDREHRKGRGTWLHILQEEVSEAFAESDPAKLRAELVQVAAVAAAWIEAIDRRAAS